MTQEIDTGGGDKGRKGRKSKKVRRERNPFERARDRREIGRLRLRFALWTLEDIAEEVNRRYYSGEEEEARCLAAAQKAGVQIVEPPRLSKQVVSLVVKALQARLDEEATEDVLKLRRLQIAELRELEEYCRTRYEETVGTHIKVRETSGGDRDGSKTTETEELQGEHPLLALAFRCKQEIIELSGTRPPRKTALTDPSGTKPFDAFGDSEELKRLAALFTEIAGHKP